MRIGIDGRNLTQRLSGITRYVHEMSLELIRQGHEVQIYAPSPVTPQVAPEIRSRTRASNAQSPIARQIWSHTQLKQHIDEFSPEVFWGPAHRLPLGLRGDITAIVTIHDLVWKLHPGTMNPRTWLGERLFMRPSLERADGIVAITESTRTALSGCFPSTTAPVEVIYPGVTTLRPPQRDTLPTTVENYILFVGTLEPRKNLERLIEAFSQLPDRLSRNTPLVIVGGAGWKLKNLKELTQRLGMTGRVRFLGHVDDATLSDLYARCLFLAMPSLYEGFGLPIIEANNAGRPALVSTNSSMPEIGGDAALLVDALSTQSISAGLRRLIEDDEFREELSTKAPSNAQRFDWARAANSLVRFFEKRVVKA
jgi:glycosyltransferase involved in cell wall biosynthesis